ncbi:MAG: hypothetical protein MJZ31_01135 [Bacteroidales bacterium]|nr:hypothetical protein [Bacteroidales bacterium]
MKKITRLSFSLHVFLFCLLFISCSSTNNVINLDNISDVYISQTLSATGNTFVSTKNYLTQITVEDLHHLNTHEKNLIATAIKNAKQSTFRNGKFGKGVIYCKMKQHNSNVVENIVICRSKEYILLFNMSNNICFSIEMQSNEGMQLMYFLQCFYKKENTQFLSNPVAEY